MNGDTLSARGGRGGEGRSLANLMHGTTEYDGTLTLLLSVFYSYLPLLPFPFFFLYTRLHAHFAQVGDPKYMAKCFDRFGAAVGQGMSTFLSTGNVTSTSGLDLMQVGDGGGGGRAVGTCVLRHQHEKS